VPAVGYGTTATHGLTDIYAIILIAASFESRAVRGLLG